MQSQVQAVASQAVSLLPYTSLPRHDPFDPNNWFLEPDEPFYIYGDDLAQIAVRVDYDDYLHFCRWRWKPKQSKRSKAIYLQRTPHGSNKSNDTVYLHIEIMKRSGILRPTMFHTIVDHKDRDPMNCQRGNMRWVTFKENMDNRVLHRADNPTCAGAAAVLG